jgi:hypothetical protein
VCHLNVASSAALLIHSSGVFLIGFAEFENRRENQVYLVARFDKADRHAVQYSDENEASARTEAPLSALGVRAGPD